jgi:hypothetical protein
MGLSRRRKFLVLGICCMSLLIVSMDTTIINVALPAGGPLGVGAA